MTHFVILDSTANLVESFDRATDARERLEAIVRQDPSHAGEYAIVKYDGDGNPVGHAITGSQLNASV
jgi:hypothetical protein